MVSYVYVKRENVDIVIPHRARDFEVPLGRTAKKRKARHHIEVTIMWHNPEVLSVHRDYARRVYVNLHMVWEEWEVPFSFWADVEGIL